MKIASISDKSIPRDSNLFSKSSNFIPQSTRTVVFELLSVFTTIELPSLPLPKQQNFTLIVQTE